MTAPLDTAADGAAHGGSAFCAFFTDGAPPLDLDATERFVVLNDLQRVLLVDDGALDLFAVQLDEGAPIGRWTFLNRVGPGAVLVGSPPGPRHCIVGRPVLGTVLRYVPNARLEALTGRAGPSYPADLSDDDRRLAVEQFLDGLESGIVALSEALRDALPPRDFVPLAADGESGGVTELDDGEATRSVDGTLWVHVEQGTVEMPDGIAGQLTAGADVCVTRRDWLVAVGGPARVRARGMPELLDEGVLWSRIVTHAARLLFMVDRRVQRSRTLEEKVLTERRDRDSGALARAARGFDAVLHDTDARIRLADVANDSPTLAAARLVASHLGFTVKAPVTSAQGRGLDELQAIALASGVRTRVVRLDGPWWQRDVGPLVGRRKAGNRPVALLPVGGRYVVAEQGAVRPVTPKLAAELHNQATMLYQPLPDDVRSVGALLRFGFRGHRGDLWTFALTGTLVAVIGLLVPIMTGAVLGTFVSQARRDLIVQGSVVVIASAFVVAALAVVQNIAVLRIESRSTSAMQVGVWTRLLSLPAAFFTRYSTGELGTTVLGVSAAQEMLSGMMTTATLGLLTGLANLGLLFWYDVQLALLATVLVLVGAGFAALAGRAEVRWQRRLYEHEQAMSSRVFQVLNAVPKLRVTAAEDRVFGVWAAEFTKGRAMAAASRRVQNTVTTFNSAFPLVCSGVLFALVAGPMGDKISVAAFLAFFTAFNLLLAASLQFSAAAITAMGVVPMLEKIQPILRAETEFAGFRADPGDLSGRLGLSHVSFRYGTEGPLTLEDVSFTIEPGEFVAFVGPSGSGKSTVLRLLLGFETPIAGTVLYDGQDLAELDVSAVRRQCGVVLQNGSLLAGDIKANIVGSTGRTLDDAWAAAEMAGIADDIRAMPMGMHTVLSEGTNTLSGGQRQRIMISRALVARPRIVFFDEATSALDNPTQKLVAESTRRLNATRVVIAHRLSTVADADKIVVLDRGRVVQQGGYEELLRDTDGVFARLAARQMS
ncbi:NHLP bacteriocin export ABC transporter permease/ATPase subunit [Yinghuangia seranimata]|uniref:NHLP bacteriocin export ABC transporter permease/ATPase subunit n=1 Tax=Yinghuangia seranimata TaxID=408067 RepID=UPI00248BC6B0|nr:NHLP bacteriocin export ABC transporter permease/ATPase subunit [Yinghuangia seranimata]MDI2130079.1 NHLP bacteriocin export ABC transporter permease/ATPase subunit [Yinghuangia seranimata]